jgi:hypothetical protein
MSRLPGFLSAPAPPIARVPGHLPSCYDGCGNYRSCVDLTCPASKAWGRPDVRTRAYDEYETEMTAWRSHLARDANEGSNGQ